MKLKKVNNHGIIRWRVNDPHGINGKRQRKFFDTKENAENFIRQQKADRDAYGIHFTTIPPSERASLGYQLIPHTEIERFLCDSLPSIETE